MFLFPVVALLRWAENYSKGSFLKPHSIPKYGINFILKSIFSSERFLLRIFNLPFGISLICIVKKLNVIFN